ncbi:uncharacterized protein LOC144590559 [Rhinoraja longicauda]
MCGDRGRPGDPTHTEMCGDRGRPRDPTHTEMCGDRRRPGDPTPTEVCGDRGRPTPAEVCGDRESPGGDRHPRRCAATGRAPEETDTHGGVRRPGEPRRRPTPTEVCGDRESPGGDRHPRRCAATGGGRRPEGPTTRGGAAAGKAEALNTYPGASTVESRRPWARGSGSALELRGSCREHLWAGAGAPVGGAGSTCGRGQRQRVRKVERQLPGSTCGRGQCAL